MTKEEFKKVLDAALGTDAYSAEVIADLVEHFDATGKYAQTAKDRLDERYGSLLGWIQKHAAEGAYAKAADEAEKIAIVLKALAAIK